MEVTLTLTEDQHEELKAHLFPDDGYEASAIILCGRCAGDRRHRLVAREVHPIPYKKCTERTPLRVTWPTDVIAPLLDRAEEHGWTVIKSHSHPNGRARFSETDDEGDHKLIPAIRDWFDDDFFHGSVVMLPNGEMFGRYLDGKGDFVPLAHINVVGDDLLFGMPIHTATTSRILWRLTPKHLVKEPLNAFAVCRLQLLAVLGPVVR